MITSSEEFVRLRNSILQEEYSRASTDEAPLVVWYEVISLYPEMREWVAHNKTVPLEVLDKLARDPSASVRATVADKRKLSDELFELLSSDSSELVRIRLARNKKTPTYILERLVGDSSLLVSSAAAESIKRE
jgi:hypothetical protein